MVTIDNYLKIKEMLNFETQDDFYHLQIIKRRKENPDMTSHSETIKTYYITTPEYFEKKVDEVHAICEKLNARAYINLNCRSFKKCALFMLKGLTDCIVNEEYSSVKNCYNSVVGQHAKKGINKLWIVDIDTKDQHVVSKIFADIWKFRVISLKDYLGPPIMKTIDTLNGTHIICPPFDSLEFSKLYPGIDIHKDNPTILFA